jgi:hypothetical protein
MNDPYQPPRATDYGNTQAGGEVPAEAVEALRETRPWVTLIAVMGFIGAGLMVLLGLAMMAMGKGLGRGIPASLGFVYVIIAALYVLPSVLLLRYSSSIGRLLEGAGTPALVDALRNQKAFWRAVGIMTLVFIGIMALSFFGGLAGAMFSKR